MPLVARNGDELVAGYSLDALAWAQLVRSNRAAPMLKALCCETPVICKTSRYGTRFFAHRPEASCEYRGESALHLQAKVVVASAGSRAGWQPRVEYADREAGWRSDVLLEKDIRRLVVEIQTSPISREELERRQDRYRAAGIEAWWMLRKPSGIPSTKETPVVQLEQDGADGLNVCVPGAPADAARLPLARFMTMLLGDQVQWAPWAGAQIPLDILTAKRRCPSGLHAKLYIVGGVLRLSRAWPGEADRALTWYSLSAGSRGQELGNLLRDLPFERDGVVRPWGQRSRLGYHLLQGCPSCTRGLREPLILQVGADAKRWRTVTVKASMAWAGQSPRASHDGFPLSWWWPVPATVRPHEE